MKSQSPVRPLGDTKVEGKGNNDKSVLACINSLERFRGKCRDATKE